MPRPQFTLRAILVAIAVAGVLSGAEVFRRRQRHFRRMAAYHALRLEEALEDAQPFDIHERYDRLRGLHYLAEKGRREADEARPKLVQARKTLEAMEAAGRATTQSDRREPWYWSIRIEEAEWSAREAEREIVFLEERIGHHRRMRSAFERGASHPWESVVVEAPVAAVFRSTAPFQPPPPPP